MKKCICKEFLRISNKVIPNLDWDFQKGVEYQYEVDEDELHGEIYYVTTVNYINRDFFRGYPLKKNMFKKYFRSLFKESDITAIVQLEEPVTELSDDVEYWFCTIGPVSRGSLPYGSDYPLRNAVKNAFNKIIDIDPDKIVCSSGWGLKSEVRDMIMSIQNLHITDPTGEKAKAINQILRS